jgi:hypothetical protein
MGNPDVEPVSIPGGTDEFFEATDTFQSAGTLLPMPGNSMVLERNASWIKLDASIQSLPSVTPKLKNATQL